MRSGRLSLGPKLEEFEAAIATYTGVPHAVAVSSGTAGLHLCLLALGIGAGDAVLVPSFTFIAAANAIRFTGATPVFVDIDPVTLNMDPERIAAAITPRTRAILAVHAFGVPAEMEPILALARQHNLLVIEDACEALGAEYSGRKAGALGDAGVFAFYPNKQITTGEGGMIVTRDAAVAVRMRALRNQGRTGSDWFDHQELGYNYRLSELACALGIAQMQRMEAILAQREWVARAYTNALRTEEPLILPQLTLPKRRISWFVYTVRLRAEFSQRDRDAILSAMAAQGIACGRYFAPIHQQPCYAEWRDRCSLPVTESLAARTLALPFFTRISQAQIAAVAQALHTSLAALPAARSGEIHAALCP
jgi:perosamine synthetase